MKHVVNQFRRIWNDDGKQDKIFSYQQSRLKNALQVLKEATDEMIRQSTRLQDLLADRAPTKH